MRLLIKTPHKRKLEGLEQRHYQEGCLSKKDVYRITLILKYSYLEIIR